MHAFWSGPQNMAGDWRAYFSFSSKYERNITCFQYLAQIFHWALSAPQDPPAAISISRDAPPLVSLRSLWILVWRTDGDYLVCLRFICLSSPHIQLLFANFDWFFFWGTWFFFEVRQDLRIDLRCNARVARAERLTKSHMYGAKHDCIFCVDCRHLFFNWILIAKYGFLDFEAKKGVLSIARSRRCNDASMWNLHIIRFKSKKNGV